MTHDLATLERPPAAGRAGAGWRPLPAIFVGESAVAAPAVHAWPGKLFVGLSRLTAYGLAIYMVMALPYGLLGLNPRSLGMGLLAGVGVVVQRRLAEGVAHFTRWGWYGAMAEVSAVTAAKLWALATGSASGIGVSLLLDVVWLRYFWRRRAEFDVDLGG
jgi:hypothetical protein